MRHPLLTLSVGLVASCSAASTSSEMTSKTSVTPLRSSAPAATTSTTTTIPISPLSGDPRITLNADLAPTSICQLPPSVSQGERIFTSVGFPRPANPDAHRSTNILLVPVSMADFQFSKEDLSYAEDAIAKAIDFWSAVSYGQADLTSATLPREHWPNLPQTSTELGFPRSSPTTDFAALANDILDGVRVSFDVSPYDNFIVALPVQPTLEVAQAFPLEDVVVSRNGIEQTGNLIGSIYLPIWETIAHELGHSWLRIPDLYSTEDREKFMGIWDLMGGGLSAGKEPTAWNRWLAGWITDDQIRCIEPTTNSVHFLEAVEIPAPHPKAVVVRVSDMAVVVVESRRNLGYDSGGLTAIVYQVDSSKYPSEGVYRLRAELSDVGDSATVEGINITLLDADESGDLVAVATIS